MLLNLATGFRAIVTLQQNVLGLHSSRLHSVSFEQFEPCKLGRMTGCAADIDPRGHQEVLETFAGT